MARQRVSVLRMKYLTYGRVRVKGYNASMILSAETREHVSAVGAGLEHPLGQDTLTFFQGSALNYGNYLDEVWTIDKRSGGVTVADLNDGTGGQRHFYHQNTLYHVYALTDEAGAIAEAVQSYDAYGKISALITGSGSDTTWFTADDVTATNPNVSTIGNTYFYTGQRVDPETGLGYWKFRYFSYDLGKWVTRDKRHKRNLNLYQYVLSQPTYYLDPMGLQEVRDEGTGDTLQEHEKMMRCIIKCMDEEKFNVQIGKMRQAVWDNEVEYTTHPTGGVGGEPLGETRRWPKNAFTYDVIIRHSGKCSLDTDAWLQEGARLAGDATDRKGRTEAEKLMSSMNTAQSKCCKPGNVRGEERENKPGTVTEMVVKTGCTPACPSPFVLIKDKKAECCCICGHPNPGS